MRVPDYNQMANDIYAAETEERLLEDLKASGNFGL